MSLNRHSDSQRTAISLDRGSEKSSSQAPSLPEIVSEDFELTVLRVTKELEAHEISLEKTEECPATDTEPSPPSTGTVSDSTTFSRQQSRLKQSGQYTLHIEPPNGKKGFQNAISIISVELQPESTEKAESLINATATVPLVLQPLTWLSESDRFKPYEWGTRNVTTILGNNTPDEDDGSAINSWKLYSTVSEGPAEQPVPTRHDELQTTEEVKNPVEKEDASGRHDSHDRRDLELGYSITHEKLIHALLSHFDPNYIEELTPYCKVTKHVEGSFNHVAYISYSRETFIIKIPLHGTVSGWTEEDAYMLRREVELMAYLKQNTTIPVPDILAFCDNPQTSVIGAPYMLMSKLAGRLAIDIWVDDGPASSDEEGGEVDQDWPSEQTVAKRTTFLCSLANAMAQLQHLEFKNTGILSLDGLKGEDSASVTHSFHWHNKAVFHEPICRKTLSSSTAYFHSALEDLEFPHLDLSEEADCHFATGLRIILFLILSTPAFTTSKTHPTARETFVLRHDDLDLQNILTDDSGNVTGILDWSDTAIVPRCIGPAALPTFLRRDWLSDYSVERGPFMDMNFSSYRDTYASFMKEQASSSDARYTAKSHMY
jgi:hypothetical protein